MSPECGSTAISLDSIRPGPSLRAGGLNVAHVAALAEVSEGWPPIVVTEDNVLVDGHHRVAAAQQLGLDRIAAVVFKGSRADAYVEAVRSNISHGMPLTLSERRRAGAQILAVHPTWSDRRIAGCCGLSAKTIKRLRESSPARSRAVDRGQRADTGRDGSCPTGRRRRPPASIVAELERYPDASLRTIAASVGASPETVRSVRNQLRADGENPNVPLEPASERRRAHGVAPANAMTVGSRSARTSRSRPERTARASPRGSTRSSVRRSDLWDQAEAVPLSRVYVVADECRRRAKFWEDFADTVESRSVAEPEPSPKAIVRFIRTRGR